MKKAGAIVLAIIALASIESAVGRWLPTKTPIPIILPLLLGASFLFPHDALLRLTLPGAAAAELGSGLPPGIAFAATLLPPHALLALNRQPRPELLWGVRAGMSALTTFAVLVFLNVPTRWAGSPPGDLFFDFLLFRLALPAVVAGGIAAISLSLLQRERTQSFLRMLGVSLP